MYKIKIVESSTNFKKYFYENLLTNVNYVLFLSIECTKKEETRDYFYEFCMKDFHFTKRIVILCGEDNS